jgi:FkbM family methyltransferase
MRKIIVHLYNLLKYYFWYSPFHRAMVDSTHKQEGSIKLFDKPFYYHFGLAFYDTYKEIFEKKIYEFKTADSSPIILDCGANMGVSALYFSKQFPNAKIIAFEPDESVLPFLEKNIQSQNLQNVELHKKGVWTEETELSFYTDNGLGGRTGIEYNNQIPTKIKTVRLKDFLNEPIAMLKIDIEGAEFDVIKDCEEKLHNVQHVFLEYHSFYNEEQHLEAILSIFKRQGYRYHLRESFSRRKPFVDKRLVCEKYDMAINVFAYRD